ncbi:MAG: hypothetical protein RL173_3622 [Fibrobacterota bacterium]
MRRTSDLRFSILLGAPVLLAGCMNSTSPSTLPPPPMLPSWDSYEGTERHSNNPLVGWVDPAQDSLSTFGADVDNGSYTFVRRKLQEDGSIDSTAVRPEEFINYFKQDYQNPSSSVFGIELEAAPSLWRGDSLHVLRVGIQGKIDSAVTKAPWNLTFLVDVSGSMDTRMDFVKTILNTLVDNMRENDILSIALYDYRPRTLLEPVTLKEKNKASLKAIISELRADGSTNMAAGMRLGYQLNDKRKISGGTNRVVVVSDGDANVGTTDADGILTLIKEHTDAGTTITTLGVGSGNYNAELMEALADRGNGNYYYLDSKLEAERVLGIKLAQTMTLIARDLKIQVAFDSNRVARYRLIGYENRAIADTAFDKDTTDGGEVGSGHTVTALYELALKPGDGALGEVRLRYKSADGKTNLVQSASITRSQVGTSAASASKRLLFTECVSEFAERLRRSPWANTPYTTILEKASASHDPADSADVELLRLIPLGR